MYVFGIDLPVVEVYLISSLLTFILFILLILLFRNVWMLNRKLDRLLTEEAQIKEELDVTKQEEDQQLVMMKEMLKEMGSLDKLTKTGEKEINAIRTIVKEIEGLSHIKMKEGKHLDYLSRLINKLDRLQSLHEKQVNKLGSILNMPSQARKTLKPTYHKIKRLLGGT